MLRVLVITYYWPPAGGAGVQRWLKLCKYLPENGVLPTVITVEPEKATYPQRDESMLGEVHPDIEVIRTNSFEPLQWYARLAGKDKVPYGGFANVSNRGVGSKVSRFIRGNFFIPDARKGWNKYAFHAAKKVISEKGIDVVITTGPPHSTHLVGLRLKKELGIKWVADFRDPWTGIYYNDLLLRTDYAEKTDARLEKEVLDRANVVVANCMSNADLLRLRKGKAPIEVIENGYDAEDFEGIERQETDTFNIVYTGTMAASYNPGVFIDGLKKLKARSDKKFCWHIAGSIDNEIKTQIELAGLMENCRFYGYLPHSEVVRLMVNADLLLNLFPETKNDRGIPGKLFEYLGARRQILNIGPKDGDAARIIAKCESGETFAREDKTRLQRFLTEQLEQWQVNQPGVKGNDFVADYTRRKLTSSFSALIKAVN
jgi:glycosyltransferase involved in cell wall biosynthesis